MSQKKAKQKRREEKKREEENANKPKPIGQIIIDVYPDLDVNVSNFPSDHNIAMMVMCNALLKLSAYFIEQQQQANNKSNILLARPGASKADIIKMASGN